MKSLLKMDIKDLFKKNKSNDTKTGSQVGKILITRISLIALFMILLFIGYWFYLKPKNELQITKINQLNQWKEQLLNCDIEIKNQEHVKNELLKYKKQKGKLFVSDEEFLNFYSDLTDATVNYGLRIFDLTRMEEEPVYVSDQIKVSTSQYVNNNEEIIIEGVSCGMNPDPSVMDIINNQNQINNSANENIENCYDNNAQNCGKVAYIKMLVNYEIRGDFLNYIKFRNTIALKEKIVNIEKEQIEEDETQAGHIIATATVSLVKIP